MEKRSDNPLKNASLTVAPANYVCMLTRSMLYLFPNPFMVVVLMLIFKYDKTWCKDDKLWIWKTLFLWKLSWTLWKDS